MQVLTVKPVTAAIGGAGVRHGNMIRACKESHRALDQGRHTEQPFGQCQPPHISLPWTRTATHSPNKVKSLKKPLSQMCLHEKVPPITFNVGVGHLAQDFNSVHLVTLKKEEKEQVKAFSFSLSEAQL